MIAIILFTSFFIGSCHHNAHCSCRCVYGISRTTEASPAEHVRRKYWSKSHVFVSNQTCLQRSFRAQVYTCPACRHDLGKDYVMIQNKALQVLLDQFFPGYSKGRWGPEPYNTLAHKHPSCAPSYTVKYLELHFEMHCTHIFPIPRARCILHITAIYVYNHSYTNNLSRDLTSSAQLGLSSLTSPAWNSNRGPFFSPSPLHPACHRSWQRAKRTKNDPQLTFPSFKFLPTCLHFGYHVCSFTPNTELVFQCTGLGNHLWLRDAIRLDLLELHTFRGTTVCHKDVALY